jgi:2-oxo-3-hexenedioate decarboxylase
VEPQEVADWAARLDQARLNCSPLEQISKGRGAYSVESGYAIQELGLKTRLSLGEKLVGMKMGLTSKAKREQMGLHHALYGVLTDVMEVRGEFSLTGKIHP